MRNFLIKASYVLDVISGRNQTRKVIRSNRHWY
jgi:hypothetical protein